MAVVVVLTYVAVSSDLAENVVMLRLLGMSSAQLATAWELHVMYLASRFKFLALFCTCAFLSVGYARCVRRSCAAALSHVTRHMSHVTRHTSLGLPCLDVCACCLRSYFHPITAPEAFLDAQATAQVLHPGGGTPASTSTTTTSTPPSSGDARESSAAPDARQPRVMRRRRKLLGAFLDTVHLCGRAVGVLPTL